jgi:uncharacterized membrane protein
MTPAQRSLVLALVALSALFVTWFGRLGDTVAVVVFGLPPLLFAVGVRFGRPHAGFWAAVVALMWFSHGIMVAWSRPGERGWALAEVVLALAIVFAASLPGLRSRFGREARGRRL